MLKFQGSRKSKTPGPAFERWRFHEIQQLVESVQLAPDSPTKIKNSSICCCHTLHQYEQQVHIRNEIMMILFLQYICS